MCAARDVPLSLRKTGVCAKVTPFHLRRPQQSKPTRPHMRRAHRRLSKRPFAVSFLEMESVKYKTVTISVYPWRHSSGRTYWRFKAGDRHVTRADLAEARKEALNHARSVYRGQIDLAELNADQTKALRRMLDADPTCRLVDEFLVWHGRRHPDKMTGEAIDEFLAAKETNRGGSPHNVRTLKRHLALLPRASKLGSITPSSLPAVVGAPRTRKNVIDAWTTFFRWCRDHEWLPFGEPTAPERIDRPIITGAIPATWTPDELETLLKQVKAAYLPWLALAAFAGLRSEEVCPDQKSKKSGLAWEDIVWERGIIIVRPETSKTGRRRVVPVNPALRAWLEPRADSGRIGPFLPPACPQKGGVMAETTRLGQFVAGWRRNALRHSFISYRAAQVGLAQTAMEAGNSESEARRSYNDAKGLDEAEKWFAVFPPQP